MTSDRAVKVEQICQAALERPLAERDPFLADACRGDKELRREVDLLLRQEQAASGFLETPAVAVAARELASAFHSLSAGQRIDSYTILSRLGVGGMGEVYRAHDATLGRDVAIKVLPSIFTDDSERLARFEREARILAALNHPNIATIHGVEQVDPAGSGHTRIHALILELVEGDTLADRLAAAQSGLPASDTMSIARQIADALEAAHDRGVVHRDLKPANIKIRPDGVVKVLDFGLAKTITPDAPDPARSYSPTITIGGTRDGVLLGTAAYMSPEQARGLPVDKRADIWAFGCVLYEMLTGRRPFDGETVTEALAAVLKEEPDWTLVPTQWQRLLRSCLEKDPKRRLRDIGDAWRQFDDPVAVPQRRLLWQRLGWASALVMLLAAAVVAFVRFSERTSVPELVRLQIPQPEGFTGPVANFAVSPDGRQLAFFGVSSDGISRLWVRPLDSLDARPLPGSVVAAGQTPFFWSHDSRFILFGGSGRLWKIDPSGGPAQALANRPDLVVGGSSNAEGDIIFGSARGGIMRVPAAGGTPAPVTVLDPSRSDRNHIFPVFLPDGRRFLYKRNSDKPDHSGIYVGSLDNEPQEQSSARLLDTSFGPAYFLPSDSDAGHLLFVRDGVLLAQPFDARTLEVKGESVPLAERIVTALNFGSFSVSRNGVLVYKTGRRQDYQLTWLDRQGKVLGQVGEPGYYPRMTLSHDDTRVALVREDSVSEQRPSVWVLDLMRGTTERLTFGTQANYPVWSPDGSRIAFTDAGFLYKQPVNDTANAALLLKPGENGFPASWSIDERFLLYSTASAETKMDLWVLPLKEDQAKPVPLLRTTFNESLLEGLAQFSPDGRWIAYTSDESGRVEVYVRAFSPAALAGSPDAGRRQMVSKGAYGRVRWRGDGKELTYQSSDGRMMAVAVTMNPSLSFGEPTALFTVPQGVLSMDQTRDGQRWLAAIPAALSTPTPFTVVINWQRDLLK